MGGVEGFKVGNYDGALWGKNDITAGKTVGNKAGYASLNQALDAAKAAPGAEVITRRDGKYNLNEVRGTHYSELSENEVSVRSYPSANNSGVVAFVDDYDNVITQFDNDENLELLGKIDKVKQKIASLPAGADPGIALKIAGAMLNIGTPESYSTGKKLEEALKKMPKYLPESLKQKFEDLLKPESVAVLTTVLTAYAASHAFGVGEAADIILTGAGLAFLGADAIKVAKNFYDFGSIASNAKTDQELENAASKLAEGISTALFDGATTVAGAKIASGTGNASSSIGKFVSNSTYFPSYVTVGGGISLHATTASAGAVKTSVVSGGVTAGASVLHMSSMKGTSGSTSTTPSHKFYNEISKLPPNERVPVVRQRADEFAKSNGWERAKDIEKKNSGRTVYRDNEGKLYSVDTQHGHFEVLNPKGKHQGSVDLWGSEVPGKLDKSGGHDLSIR